MEGEPARPAARAVEQSRAVFEPLIRARDADGIMAALTFPAQEAAVAARVARKAALYGASVADVRGTGEMDPQEARRRHTAACRACGRDGADAASAARWRSSAASRPTRWRACGWSTSCRSRSGCR